MFDGLKPSRCICALVSTYGWRDQHVNLVQATIPARGRRSGWRRRMSGVGCPRPPGKGAIHLCKPTCLSNGL